MAQSNYDSEIVDHYKYLISRWESSDLTNEQKQGSCNALSMLKQEIVFRKLEGKKIQLKSIRLLDELIDLMCNK